MKLRYERFGYSEELFPETVEPAEVWTQQDIVDIRSWILHESCNQLIDTRVGLDIRTESLDWVMSDLVEPFSFLVCCWHEEVNPFTYREELISYMKRQNRIKERSKS